MIAGDKIIPKMTLLRWLLVAFNALWCAFFIYAFTSLHTQPGIQLATVATCFIFLSLNLFYLVMHRTKPQASRVKVRRIRTLIGLWLDTKEAELRARSQRQS